MKLADIKTDMLFSDLHALITQKSTGTTKTGSAYADITLGDGNTSIKCKKWTYNADKYDEITAIGKVIKVSGKSSMYNGELQGTLDMIEPSDKSPAEFAKKSRFDSETLYAKLIGVIDGFEDPLPKYIATKLLTQHKEEFCKAPAAIGIHHAWFGGLLEHTYSMVALASRICRFYQDQYGPIINRDRLLFGVLFHDFGKIFEYDSSTPAFKMKPGGVLMNHIVRCPIIIYQAAAEYCNEAMASGGMAYEEYPAFERERDLLIHLIASHHGSLEFGSPVIPSCLEAVLLHQIDMVDCKFMHALDLIENGKDGVVEGFSERSRTEKAQYLRI